MHVSHRPEKGASSAATAGHDPQVARAIVAAKHRLDARRMPGLLQRARAVEDIVEACVDDYLRFRERDTDDITLLILRKK